MYFKCSLLSISLCGTAKPFSYHVHRKLLNTSPVFRLSVAFFFFFALERQEDKTRTG